MTVVLIAANLSDAKAWADAQPAGPSVIVPITPRSPRAARGVTASLVLATPAGRALAAYDALVAEALPTVMAVRR